MAIRVVLVEDNDVFRNALEVLLTLGGEIEIVASEADGEASSSAARELAPDVLLVDYRLPGLDGVQVTRLVREHCPDVAVVALTAAAEERERRGAARGGRVGLHRQGQAARRDHRRGPRRRRPADGAQRREHGDRPRLDRRLPEGPERFPNWRVVPLYVRFGDESFKDYVELVAARVLRAAAELQGDSDDLAADARRLPRDLRGAGAATSGSCRCTSRRSSRGRSRARGRPARRSAAARCARSTAGRSRPGSRCSPSPCSAGSSAGTTDEDIDALVERSRRESRVIFTVDTLEFLPARRPDREGGGDGRDAPEHQADPRDRGRRGRPAQTRPRRAQGVPGVRRGVRGRIRRPAVPARRDRPCGRARARHRAGRARPPHTPACADRGRDDARRGRRDARRARAASASSGSTTPARSGAKIRALPRCPPRRGGGPLAKRIAHRDDPETPVQGRLGHRFRAGRQALVLAAVLAATALTAGVAMPVSRTSRGHRRPRSRRSTRSSTPAPAAPSVPQRVEPGD